MRSRTRLRVASSRMQLRSCMTCDNQAIKHCGLTSSSHSSYTDACCVCYIYCCCRAADYARNNEARVKKLRQIVQLGVSCCIWMRC
jgi:hypothetical protein